MLSSYGKLMWDFENTYNYSYPLQALIHALIVRISQSRTLYCG
jgi:hypothetical protein